MAAGSISIIPKLVQFSAAGATAITTATLTANTPAVDGSSVFAGMEVEGRSLDISVDEVMIEDGQTTQTKYIASWEMFIQGSDALTASATNKASTPAYVKKQIIIYGAVGTLGVALDDVYVWAEPDYTTGKVRTKITCKKEFIQPPDTDDSPLGTFTVNS